MVKAMAADTGWSKATIFIMLGRMEEKGAVRVEEGGRAKQYFAAVPKEQIAAQNIFIGFGGQPQHEIELHMVPAPRKRSGAGIQNLLLREIFIDYVPQTLRTRLRRKCEDLHIHPEGRQRQYQPRRQLQHPVRRAAFN